MHFLSQASQYAISALIALARDTDQKAISAADLARPLNCPAAYLSQTLAKLVPHGIIDTRRGLNGGVYLCKAPSEITVYDVVSIIDGEDFFTKCFLGIEGCGKIEPCPFHFFWKANREAIQVWMKTTSIEDANTQMSDAWFNLRLKYR